MYCTIFYIFIGLAAASTRPAIEKSKTRISNSKIYKNNKVCPNKMNNGIKVQVNTEFFKDKLNQNQDEEDKSRMRRRLLEDAVNPILKLKDSLHHNPNVLAFVTGMDTNKENSVTMSVTQFSKVAHMFLYSKIYIFLPNRFDCNL